MVTIPAALKNLGLPEPDQIGFVVRDIDEAVARYEPLFGPFKRTDFGINYASYHGGPRSPYDMKFAFGRIGNLEIELIQWVSGDTPHRDFIQAGREGMHHIRFRVPKADPWVAKLKTIGYEPVWHDRLSDDIAYAYCERAGDPLILEIFEYPASGDGTDPLP